MYSVINGFMKILLISPNIKGMEGGVNRIQPPLGIAYLSAYLSKEHEVIIYDTAIEGWNNQISLGNQIISIGESDSAIEQKIRSIKPDVVGISILFGNLMDSALNIAKICKQVSPTIQVVCGGNYITNVIRDWQTNIRSGLFYSSDIDYYFVGEADIAFLEFLKSTNKKKSPGICFFFDDRLVVNEPSPFMNLSNGLDPMWELFDMEKYFSVGLSHSAQSYSPRVLPVMASRGCPEKCQFCTTPQTWGSSVRWKDTYKLYLEMSRFISKYQIGEIQFQDDTITAHLPKLYQLCEYIKEFKLPWCTPNGIKLNYHTPKQSEMFTKMKESGCYQVTLACESGVQRVLDNIVRKNLQVNQFKPSIQRAKDAGLMVHTFWIVGFPGETREEMERTIEIASECGADSFSVSILTPLPGTSIYRKVITENLWWDNSHGPNSALFRKSLVQVDGFDSPESFENWVDAQNLFLNDLLGNLDPKRYQSIIAGRGLKVQDRRIKQT